MKTRITSTAGQTAKLMMTIVTACGLTFSSIAQDCKYSENDIDKSTNKLTKQTKSDKLIYVNGEGTLTGQISIRRVDTDFYLVLSYEFQKAKSGIEANIPKGTKLMFLLENKETITVKASSEVKGEKDKKAMGIYYCNLNNVSYPISKEELTKFLTSKVKTIRFSHADAFGEEVNIMVEVKEKRQELISDLAKCVL
jgi:hypothetical protein